MPRSFPLLVALVAGLAPGACASTPSNPKVAASDSSSPHALNIGDVLVYDTTDSKTSGAPPRGYVATRARVMYTVLRVEGDALFAQVDEQVEGAAAPSHKTEMLHINADLPSRPRAAPGNAAQSAPGPSAVNAPQFGESQRIWVGEEKVTTPAGSFETVHVITKLTEMSSGVTVDAWYAPGIPLPVKEISVTGAGAVIRHERVLVRIERH